ncbi:LysE family translocator [Vibrio ruber]|uniref:LysE family translocator n=1 Tax=Vibrio ruber TaxID=184755 RepID=UPI002892F40A|nr:LysE family translocator [Vibrio ruber]WNJ97235.1 LysE family translocator [Vibrio ruber]
MELQNVLTFIMVATLLVISPGPNGFLIAKTVSTSGRSAGFANVWGFVTAFYVHGTLSIFGISVFLLHCAEAFYILKIVGAAYLIWLGVKSLRNVSKISEIELSGHDINSPKYESIHKAYIEGFLTNVLNPKVSIFYLAAFPQFLTVNDSALSAYALVSAHAAINFMWFSAMILLLSGMKKATNSIKFRKWLSSVTGVIFIGFGAKLAFLKP